VIEGPLAVEADRLQDDLVAARGGAAAAPADAVAPLVREPLEAGDAMPLPDPVKASA
jgi:hypothetical protein